jgi:hypothetical protein
LDENFARLITTFDEVPLLCARTKARMRLASHAHPSSARSKGVDLKRRPPKVSSDRKSRVAHRLASKALAPRARSAVTPPSTFLFLPIHLSNSVEPRWIPSP